MGLLPIAANAYDAQIDGIYYTFNGDEAEVTCLDLDRSYNVNAYSGAIVVPESVNYDGKDYRVTSIGEGAFGNCKNLTSVILPKGVESIGNYSFSVCKSLTAVALPEGVKSIGTGAFSGCTSLESVTLPSSLTSIGEIAFRRCTCLISITIPEGVKDISYGTFASCSNMTDIIFSEGVTSIGEGAFQGCSKLTSISIPNSATYIGEYAFLNCSSLLSIIFGKNMTKIDEYAFKNDHLLTDIYCLAEEVPEATNAFSAWSYRPMESTTLHVPASSIDSYKTTEPWNCFGNVVAIESPVTFTAGQMATVILPSETDARKGKYYRLDRVEAGQIVFEQELQPRAHVPYIIVPFEDFSIDPGQLELEGLKPDTVSVDGISFIGTFRRDEIDSKDGLHVEIIDATPDCSLLPAEGQGERLAFAGTLRAYLTWHDPYNPGGSKGPQEEMKIVLHDHGTGILSPGPSPEGEGRRDATIYDLSGKKVNGKWLNGKSHKGIYIKDRKKWVTK